MAEHTDVRIIRCKLKMSELMGIAEDIPDIFSVNIHEGHTSILDPDEFLIKPTVIGTRIIKLTDVLISGQAQCFFVRTDVHLGKDHLVIRIDDLVFHGACVEQMDGISGFVGKEFTVWCFGKGVEEDTFLFICQLDHFAGIKVHAENIKVSARMSAIGYKVNFPAGKIKGIVCEVHMNVDSLICQLSDPVSAYRIDKRSFFGWVDFADHSVSSMVKKGKSLLQAGAAVIPETAAESKVFERYLHIISASLLSQQTLAKVPERVCK